MLVCTYIYSIFSTRISTELPAIASSGSQTGSRQHISALNASTHANLSDEHVFTYQIQLRTHLQTCRTHGRSPLPLSDKYESSGGSIPVSELQCDNDESMVEERRIVPRQEPDPAGFQGARQGTAADEIIHRIRQAEEAIHMQILQSTVYEEL